MTERELDQIIDGGLASYVADPVPGLERRVASRAGQGARPTSGYWLLGGVAAAAVLAVMWMPQSAGVPSAVVPMPAPPVIALTVSTPAAPVLPAALQVRRRAVTVAKPQGVPMSSEERQLLQLAQSHPELLQQVLTDAPTQLSVPLSIEPIVIKPLEFASVSE